MARMRDVDEMQDTPEKATQGETSEEGSIRVDTNALAALTPALSISRPPARLATLPRLDGQGRNAEAVYCPNEACQCMILRAGVASRVERKKDALDLFPGPSPFSSAAPADGSGTISVWLVDSPFAFENLGFTKTVAQVKYLACADCDLGPLGWAAPAALSGKDEAPAMEYLLITDRVVYSAR